MDTIRRGVNPSRLDARMVAQRPVDVYRIFVPMAYGDNSSERVLNVYTVYS
jgi:hypothetical protein